LLKQEEARFKDNFKMALLGQQPLYTVVIREDVPQIFKDEENHPILTMENGEMDPLFHRLVTTNTSLYDPPMHRLRWMRELEQEVDMDLNEFI